MTTIESLIDAGLPAATARKLKGQVILPVRHIDGYRIEHGAPDGKLGEVMDVSDIRIIKED